MFDHNTHPRRLRPTHGWLATLAAAAMLATAPAGAQELSHISHLTVASNEYGATQSVLVDVNKSLVLDLPGDVAEVIVSQPAVAGAIMRTTRRAIIQGISAGDTNIIFLDAAGRTVSVIEASVSMGTSNVGTALETTLRRVLPGANIVVESVVLTDFNGQETNRVVLSGTAQSTDDADKAITIASQFSGSPDNVASVINITGPQQVMLKVTVAEVSRETVKQLGINLAAVLTNGGLTTNLLSTQPLGGASNVITNTGLGVAGAIGNVTLEAMLRALERRGAMRTLAEPTLTAKSGQSAEFLAGGEFPVPTDVDEDGRITYTFKEFGVKLNFTPTVRSSGVVELMIDTSVSEPSSEGSFTVGSVTIPGTKERMAKTTVELQSGMTLAIGGLMEDKVRQQINQMPGLGNIPILGALFRSRDFVHSQTELIVLVTPYLVEPSSHIPLPTDNDVVASDAEAIFLGHLESMYGVGDNAGMRGGFNGSVGFVLD